MPARPFVLLPPSQSKTVGGVARRAGGVFNESLAAHRSEVVSALTKMLDAPEAVARLTGARGALLERAECSFAQVIDGSAKLLPTWRRYDGVVWRHLDAVSMASAHRKRLLVPSALYGITGGADLIADYRLTFGARIEGVGRLDDFWRDAVTEVVSGSVGAGTVVDVLPTEHRRAIDWVRLRASTSVITVRFEHAGGTRAAGHDAKAVKGVLARALLVDGVTALDTFAWGHWRCVARDDTVAVVQYLG